MCRPDFALTRYNGADAVRVLQLRSRRKTRQSSSPTKPAAQRCCCGLLIERDVHAPNLCKFDIELPCREGDYVSKKSILFLFPLWKSSISSIREFTCIRELFGDQCSRFNYT